ncbi:MAG: hypothetical protein EXR60_03095 [Dehalococcoidia bacterium]|nr:hypothetical protein [Dehalococcoidia bacterium]
MADANDVQGWWRNYLDQQMKSWTQIVATVQPQVQPVPDTRGALNAYTSGLQTWRQLMDQAFSGYQGFLNTALEGRVPGTAVGTQTAALEGWRQAADQAFNSYFSVLNSVGQNLPGSSFPNPLAGLSGDEATKGLKRFTEDTIEQWSKSLEQTVGSEEFAKQIGESLDKMLNQVALAQRNLDAATERTWRAINLPSRQQVTRLLEQFKVLEMRLEGLEDKLAAALAHNGAQAMPSPEPSPEPAAPRASRRRK